MRREVCGSIRPAHLGRQFLGKVPEPDDRQWTSCVNGQIEVAIGALVLRTEAAESVNGDQTRKLLPKPIYQDGQRLFKTILHYETTLLYVMQLSHPSSILPKALYSNRAMDHDLYSLP